MIPVNFEYENFTEKLIDYGFDADAKTLFSWLGVTYYLTKPAIERTFGLLSGLAKSGSHLVFDYLLSSVLDGTIQEKAALRHAQFVARIGEPWLWGIAPGQLTEFLAGYDFQLITDYDAVKLRDVYRHDRALMDYIRITHCIKF
jgi:methyltransferase (TIGR00027 family)